ncbi:MAG: rod shape-determining protein RodA [Prevotella sp.]|nr:rod shape-determining protein RodA [Prevotella sp.]
MTNGYGEEKKGVLRSLDYWTIAFYLLLLVGGWFSVCGASYELGTEVDLFSLDTRSGMQIVWIGTSLVLALLIMLLDDRYFDMFAYVIFGFMLLLLFATIFNPHSIKGSRSWLVMGPLRLQPAEFAKFATALVLAKFMSGRDYNIHNMKDFLRTLAIIFTPMLFIVMQRETGSALVYLAFFLVLYREGLTGSVLFTAVAAVFYFVVGIRYSEPLLLETPTHIGRFVVLLSIQVFSIVMVGVYLQKWRQVLWALMGTVGLTLIALGFSLYVLPFDIYWIQLAISVGLVVWLVWQAIATQLRPWLWIAFFAVGSILFFHGADYALNHVLEPHQRTRINVLLGLEDDLKGAGYNVHQSEIAIGSGGLTGKGFLNGTQTKLKYVPEQDTDFIFCTVGEEQGFVGSAGVLLLFLALILRLVHVAERQPTTFGRVYGYCVLSIFLFHVFINVGMVLGMTPVIGIPLPFFSYGGSSLWGFTILLFILLRIDAGRNLLPQ